MKHLFTPEGEAALQAILALRPLLAFDFDGTLAPIVVRPDGSLVNKEGGAKTKLTYQAKRKSGKLKFHYEIAPINVK